MMCWIEIKNEKVVRWTDQETVFNSAREQGFYETYVIRNSYPLLSDDLQTVILPEN